MVLEFNTARACDPRHPGTKEATVTTAQLRDELLTIAIHAVASACRLTRQVQTHATHIRRQLKEDQSPVTLADYAAQAVVARHLHEAFGGLALVGEEDATALRVDAAVPLLTELTALVQQEWPGADTRAVLDAIDLGNHDATGSRYWTLDPVDGTKGFLRGGQYAVSLALIERGQVVLGVLGCPNLSEDFSRAFDDPDPRGSIFYAMRRGGSWSVRADNPLGPARRLDTSRHDEIAAMRVCESVEAAHSRLDDTARIVEYLGVRAAPARLDSQCKYAVIARGQAEAYLRLPTRRDYVEKIWDHAAGMLLAEEAGAIVTDIDGRPLDFNHGAGLSANRGIICATRACYRPLRQAITALGLFSN